MYTHTMLCSDGEEEYVFKYIALIYPPYSFHKLEKIPEADKATWRYSINELTENWCLWHCHTASMYNRYFTLLLSEYEYKRIQNHLDSKVS